MLKEENIHNRIPIYESLYVSLLLAVVGGFLDAYTYILRGNVFANAQTGNIVLMSIKLANADLRGAFVYLIPITAFFAGVVITEYTKRKFPQSQFIQWQTITIIIEILLLFVVALIPIDVLSDKIVNVTISFTCSIQVNSFRKVRGLPYASTMCTGNLRSATEHFCNFIFGKDKQAAENSVFYFLVIFVFCIGAILGTILIGVCGKESIWICCLILLLVLGVGKFRK